MTIVTIRLLKPGKQTTVMYQGELLCAEPGHVLVYARWDRPAYDLGYVMFEPGDLFYEHFYTEHWFNIFEVHSADGHLKGWYCNITRPAQLDGTVVTSEDLELDLFVPPDRSRLIRLDEEEFAARDFATSDPATHAAALAALDELERMAMIGVAPFDAT